jgi:NADH-quinone oxidoreductase subunit M
MLPLLFVLLARLGLARESLRAVAIACACGTLAACAAALTIHELNSLRIPWPWPHHALLGNSLFRVSEFSSLLLLLPATLWIVTVAVTPRSRIDSAGFQRTALSTLSATLAFLTDSPALLVGFWIVSNLLFLGSLSWTKQGRVRRVAGWYLWTSAAVLFVGVVLSTLMPGSTPGVIGLWLVVVAILIRQGIFPFQAWIPEVFDSGRIGPMVRFSAPQLGSYAAVVLVVPHASSGMLRTLAILSLVTAVYGAALAVVQRDARRACGYLFVSQSALVLAGLDCDTPQALAGSLVLWLSSALAFTGLARTVLVLEARRGRLDLTTYHGGYEQMPQLAVSFLILGLACAGFPGTLGFIGQEMLVEGAVHEFPTLGFFVVAATALTGVAVLRMYFSLFCGTRTFLLRNKLLRREILAFGALTAILIVGGLLPRPIIASRLRASRSILNERFDSSASSQSLPAASRFLLSTRKGPGDDHEVSTPTASP